MNGNKNVLAAKAGTNKRVTFRYNISLIKNVIIVKNIYHYRYAPDLFKIKQLIFLQAPDHIERRFTDKNKDFSD